jgi:polyhydroxybutyrate depolymerase
MKILRLILGSVLVVAAVLGGFFYYFLHAPAPKAPQLSGSWSSGTIAVGGLERTYLVYRSRALSKRAPLLVVLHGSGGNGKRARVETGYAFERLADEHGFALAYPDGFEGYWNACNVSGDFAANTRNIDDVAFLTALAGKLAADAGIDRSRVFVAGISRGGAMALRLALEAPSRFRAVAAVAASLPAPDNFKCEPGQGSASVMIMNGTQDPLNPFDGGKVTLYGFLERGMVLSSRASAELFVRLNRITAAPERSEIAASEGFRVEQFLWRDTGAREIALVAVHGGGHGLPQPFWRVPRLLGATAAEPNGAALIWSFFQRQQSTSVSESAP